MNDKDGGDSGPETPTPHSQALTRSTKKRRRSSSPSDNHGGKKQALERLPPAVLLLSLPGLLAVPPNHKQQVACYELSLKALRKCVALGGLAPDIECRAWMGIAELGLRLVRAGWHKYDFPWARGLDLEVSAQYSFFTPPLTFNTGRKCNRKRPPRLSAKSLSVYPQAEPDPTTRPPRTLATERKVFPFASQATYFDVPRAEERRHHAHTTVDSLRHPPHRSISGALSNTA